MKLSLTDLMMLETYLDARLSPEELKNIRERIKDELDKEYPDRVRWGGTKIK